jgi:RNA polymerase sigma-B factor
VNAPALLAEENKTAPLTNAERDQVTVDLLTQATDADPLRQQELRSEAIELNIPLARYLASRYQRRGIPSDDLEQVAYLGLVKAVRGFTPGRVTGFAAYAIPTIRGELRRHFRDTGWTIRPPRRIQELQARVRSTTAELTQILNRTPTVKEIAAELEVDVEEVLEASSVDSCFTPSSLDAPVPGNEDLSNDPGTLDPEFDRSEARVVLAPALEDLGERDRKILDLRFVEGLTQKEIGEVVGISQMQVSRILARVLDTMRESILGQAA